ncbi:hypothetical protein FF011L_53200 [Roseimaritima multifibrata]|uniref:Uncharacterized protein n=1 Tax=Roseimaritima multifibrata TaxID=1930274 RepID=A0A517MNP4_9BACT|nr:hypothetical protein [Roseimaritima multifibrata]QDS96508.1 hypothetical protein FF011L_53200 [Roseimaritima multifibrata]
MRHIPFPTIAWPRLARFALCLCLANLFLPNRSASAQLPVIELRSLSQSIFAPGGEYEVAVAAGSHTDESEQLEFSHPGIVATVLMAAPQPLTNAETKRYGNFRVTLSPDVPEGRYEVRAIGRFGISNPRSILVDKGAQPIRPVQSDPSSASPLALDAVYFNHATSQSRNFYSLPVVAGKEYLVRLMTHSIDSRMLASASLINRKAQTIRSVIGTDYSDLEFAFIAEETAPLTIMIHDALYRGGPDYSYGLQVTESTDSDSPPSSIAQHPLVISAPALQPIRVAESDTTVNLQVPGAVESDFDSPTDQDQFICKLQKASPVTIEVVSQRLGEPTDVRMVVERAIDDAAGVRTWQRVATAEDSHNVTDAVIRLATNDPILNFTPPEDGDYRITLTDLDTGLSLGSVQRYQLSVAPPNDSWELAAYHVYPNKDANVSRPTGAHLARGGALTIRVFAIRNQMTAPIKVTIPDLPPGLSCPPAWIASNQNQTDLIVTASAEAPIQQAEFQVQGIAMDGTGIEAAGDKEASDPASSAPANPAPAKRIAKSVTVVWEKDGYRPTAHTRLTDSLAIASSELDVYPVSIDPASTEPITTAKGTKPKVLIKVQRQEGSKDAIVLRGKNLPAGVAAGDLTIPADKSEAEWTIDVTANAKPGTYTFWGQGETKVKFAVNPQSLTRATKLRDDLKTMRADESRADEHAAIDKAIAEAEKQIESITKQTAVKDFTVYVPSSLITLVVQ